MGEYFYGEYTTKGMKHPFQFASAYAPLGPKLAFTNYTGDFIGVLDYIWYSTPHFNTLKVLQPVDEESVLKQTGALPNAYYCSDHISLCAEFELSGGNNNNMHNSNNNSQGHHGDYYHRGGGGGRRR